MSTSVSVHVFLPGTVEAPAMVAAPREVLDLFHRFGQPLNYGRGPLSSELWFAAVVQFGVGGIEKLATGKLLLEELAVMGYEARLHVLHRSSQTATAEWWPQPPDWPTWDWPAERVTAWLHNAHHV